MSTPTPFSIGVSDDALLELRKKLELTTFPDELDEAGWNYGAPLGDIKKLTQYWKDKYDWRQHEKALNEELPQFTCDVDVEGFGTLNIHFVHKKSNIENAIPLLFIHGWPGSFLEVRKILPLLTFASPNQPAFHVIAPSLPGFGFSEAPKKKGFKAAQYAEIGNKLMLSLGYDEYVTQGGDWGYIVTREIARIYGKKHSKAWHTNMPFCTPPELLKNPFEYLRFLVTPLSVTEKAGLERSEKFFQTEFGYFHQQSTKPQTLGYSLADSPVGLLAWIYEKLASSVDGYVWTEDEVLTWISIYWFSRAGPTASLRIYHEVPFDNIGVPPTIPKGISHFPKEHLNFPRRWILRDGYVVFSKEKEKGGHFAASEVPEALVVDLREMFGRHGPAFGVVKGKNGYAPVAKL